MRSMHFLLISRVPNFFVAFKRNHFYSKVSGNSSIVRYQAMPSNDFSYLSTSYFEFHIKKNMLEKD